MEKLPTVQQLPKNLNIDVQKFRGILDRISDLFVAETGEKCHSQNMNVAALTGWKRDVTYVNCFLGVGCQGAFIFETSMPLLQQLAATKLYCEVQHLTDEMLNEVVSELSNKVLSIVGDTIGPNPTKSTMQLYAAGNKHSFLQKHEEGALELSMIWRDMLFKLTFFQADCLPESNNQVYFENQSPGVLDVRMLNNMLDAVSESVSTMTNIQIKRLPIEPQLDEANISQALPVIHGFGEQGSYYLAFDFPKATSRLFAKKLLNCGDDEITEEILSDSLDDLVSQINFQYTGLSNEIGYVFGQMFYFNFFSHSNFIYSVNFVGPSCRVKYLTENGGEFAVCFGIDSRCASEIFDASGLLDGIP